MMNFKNITTFKASSSAVIAPPKHVKISVGIAIIISLFLILKCYESLYSRYSKRL